MKFFKIFKAFLRKGFKKKNIFGNIFSPKIEIKWVSKIFGILSRIVTHMVYG